MFLEAISEEGGAGEEDGDRCHEVGAGAFIIVVISFASSLILIIILILIIFRDLIILRAFAILSVFFILRGFLIFSIFLITLSVVTGVILSPLLGLLLTSPGCQPLLVAADHWAAGAVPGLHPALQVGEDRRDLMVLQLRQLLLRVTGSQVHVCTLLHSSSEVVADGPGLPVLLPVIPRLVRPRVGCVLLRGALGVSVVGGLAVPLLPLGLPGHPGPLGHPRYQQHQQHAHPD